MKIFLDFKRVKSEKYTHQIHCQVSFFVWLVWFFFSFFWFIPNRSEFNYKNRLLRKRETTTILKELIFFSFSKKFCDAIRRDFSNLFRENSWRFSIIWFSFFVVVVVLLRFVLVEHFVDVSDCALIAVERAWSCIASEATPKRLKRFGSRAFEKKERIEDLSCTKRSGYSETKKGSCFLRLIRLMRKISTHIISTHSQWIKRKHIIIIKLSRNYLGFCEIVRIGVIYFFILNATKPKQTIEQTAKQLNRETKINDLTNKTGEIECNSNKGETRIFKRNKWKIEKRWPTLASG